MITEYSHLQMLQTWRRCAGLESSASDCSVGRFDGTDVDPRLSAMMRQWYLGLLDSGDPCLTGPPADATDLVSPVMTDDSDRQAVIAADPSVRRLTAVRLSGWKRPAVIADADSIRATLALQHNRFSRAGTTSPLAWRNADGTVCVCPADKDSTVTAATAFVDTGSEIYRLDERALATIPIYISNHQTTSTLL